MAITEPRALAGLVSDPDYRRIWLIGACTGVGRWLEMLVIGVYAFELTGSPFLVALPVVIRLVPLALFGSVVGTFADRHAPRQLLFAGLVVAALASGGVFILLAAGMGDYWVVIVASVASGVVWTVDTPLRRRMIGDIAGDRQLVSAISLDSATGNATRMVGPFAGGLLYQWFGAAGGFGLTAALHLLAAVTVLRVAAGRAAEPRGESPKKILFELREGFSFAITNRDVLLILLVTIAFNAWGLPFLAMIPVIGSERLGLGAAWIGGLASLEGAGAFLGALWIALRPPAFSYRRIYFFSALGYVVFAFFAGVSADVWSMSVVLFCIGLSVAGFGALQSTLIYSVAPPHMRSRLFGLMVICIGLGLFGVINMGIMGEWYGGAGAVRIVAAEGIVALLILGLMWRELRR